MSRLDIQQKLKAIDLFCKAGGATKGLQSAGFHVTGVDKDPQPNYCGDDFIQADALTVDLSGFDFIWASPPCQFASKLTEKKYRPNHPNLIPQTRARLIATGKPYVIENVPDARRELINPIMLCGTMFDLAVQRHRYFESPFTPFVLLPPCRHDFFPVYVSGSPRRKVWNGSEFVIDRSEPSVRERRDAMRIQWMTQTELDAAIPPAYSEFLGKQILQMINSAIDFKTI
jgi:DNA (cytosine-5)-methyltransferase 1